MLSHSKKIVVLGLFFLFNKCILVEKKYSGILNINRRGVASEYYIWSMNHMFTALIKMTFALH